MLVAGDGLVGVEPDSPAIHAGAFCGQAVLVVQQLPVLVALDPKLERALLHEDVLTDGGRVNALLALAHTLDKGLNGGMGEDLHRALHGAPPLAVLEVHGLVAAEVAGAQVLPQPVREKHGIGVHFGCPVILLEETLVQNLGPGPEEDVRVQEHLLALHVRDGAHLGHGPWDRRRCAAAAERHDLVAEDSPAVAGKDAHAPQPRRPHQLHLRVDLPGAVLDRHRHAPAVERRCAEGQGGRHRSGGHGRSGGWQSRRCRGGWQSRQRSDGWRSRRHGGAIGLRRAHGLVVQGRVGGVHGTIGGQPEVTVLDVATTLWQRRYLCQLHARVQLPECDCCGFACIGIFYGKPASCSTGDSTLAKL
mmetsp:Transcript_107138/g.302972  ORF Transcript_107138/g.302972 Transcript_107138/m.302972 type:complete len:361 (+) Transcript_107138:786-1868(+)